MEKKERAFVPDEGGVYVCCRWTEMRWAVPKQLCRR